MKTYIRGAVVLLIVAAIGFALGRYFTPVQIKEVEKIKVVEVEKVRTDIREDRDVTTVVTQKPDGTTITETKDTTTVTTTVDSEKDSVATSDTLKVTTYKRPSWKFTGLAGLDLRRDNFDFSYNIVYGGMIERRIFGPVFIGGFGVSNGTFGLSLSFEF